MYTSRKALFSCVVHKPAETLLKKYKIIKKRTPIFFLLSLKMTGGPDKGFYFLFKCTNTSIRQRQIV